MHSSMTYPQLRLIGFFGLLFLRFGLTRAADSFVTTEGVDFFVGSKPFSFIGTNCYYLLYSDEFMLESAMQKAALNNFTVMRTWAWLDIGYPNGTGSVDGGGMKNGVWFRAWDPESQTVVINQTNLIHLDSVVAVAKKWGIRLILTVRVSAWRGGWQVQ
jgi:mannan endo-1,4-beta-mannosidase